MSPLAKAGLLLFALLALHTLDHGVNQPAREQPGSAELVGLAGFAIVATSAVLALWRSPLAPAAALAAGSLTVLGVLAVHVAPEWADWVSDPYWDFDANALSWLSLAGLLAAAVWLTIVAARAERPLEV